MSLLPGYSSSLPNAVCRLKKSLYGLRQASRQWNIKFTQSVLQYGFTQSQHDHTLFTLQNSTTFMVLLVYVDDIIVISPDLVCIDALEANLNSTFKIKDLGTIRYFLGLEIARSSVGFSISQRKYALDILQDSGFIGAHPSCFSMEQNLKLSREEGQLLTDPYRD